MSLCTPTITSLFRRREDERERDREHRRREERPRDRRDDRDRERDGRSRSSADNSDLRHRLNRDRYVTSFECFNLLNHYFVKRFLVRNMTFQGSWSQRQTCGGEGEQGEQQQGGTEQLLQGQGHYPQVCWKYFLNSRRSINCSLLLKDQIFLFTEKVSNVEGIWIF